MISFGEFLLEKEKIVQTMYGLNSRGQSPGKSMASSVLKSVKPARAVKPFDGMKVGKIFDKPERKKSGIVGE